MKIMYFLYFGLCRQLFETCGKHVAILAVSLEHSLFPCFCFSLFHSFLSPFFIVNICCLHFFLCIYLFEMKIKVSLGQIIFWPWFQTISILWTEPPRLKRLKIQMSRYEVSIKWIAVHIEKSENRVQTLVGFVIFTYTQVRFGKVWIQLFLVNFGLNSMTSMWINHCYSI